MRRILEGEFSFGDGVVGRRLHESVDEHRHRSADDRDFGKGQLSQEVGTVDGQKRERRECDSLFGGHDLAIGEGDADHRLGGSARACGIGGSDTGDGESRLGDLDGSALLNDSRDILAALGGATRHRLERATHGAADLFEDF